jgi:2,4-dienoyl-CoA reductase-like NADH-dependent reductase (Old Yellow Enzyme family)
MTTLFTPIQLGDLRLPNRIFMAPLTRSRGTEDLPQSDLMAKYYRQRATAGLIVSEALPIDPMAVGYARVPGIWSPAQVEAWKPVTDAVHSENGTIFAQLWHVGRISHSRFLQGRLPVAPSAIRPAGHLSLVRPITPYEIPRALSLGEVKQIPELFQLAARHAKEAGFDGVELHGANGYLLDQFLQSSTNQRSDEYGGSIENRTRLMLECTDAVIQVFGPGRVGMHLAPRRDDHDMGDDNPGVTFGGSGANSEKSAVNDRVKPVRLTSFQPFSSIEGGKSVNRRALKSYLHQSLLMYVSIRTGLGCARHDSRWTPSLFG